MNKRVVAGVIAVVAGCIVFLLWHRRGPSIIAPLPAAAVARPALPPAAANAPEAKARADVTVRDDRGPIAGAIVRFAPVGGEVVVARTGADGVAHADDLVAGTWKISASAPGHEPAALAPRAIAPAETAALALTLAIGGRTLAGTVIDATGGPISGARIDAAHVGAGAKLADAVSSALTGGDGKYQLTVAEGQAVVAASSPDYAPQARYVQIGPPGATADFALVPGGVVEGVVRDEHSREPVPGAEVEAARDAPTMMLGEASHHRVVATADGRFRVTGLRPGAYVLNAKLGPRRSREPTRVGLGVAEQAGGVEILVGVGPAIRGVAVDEAGVAQAGVEIQTFEADASAKTDGQGAFALEGLPPGQYGLFGARADLVPVSPVAVQLGGKDVDGVRVILRSGVKVVGRVEPREVCDVAIRVGEMMGPQLYTKVDPVTTGDDGVFALGPVAPGDGKITAHCANGDLGEQAVHVANAMGEIVVTVSSSASIAGHLVDGTGEPIAGATVIANPRVASDEATIVNGMITSGVQAHVDDTGAFELTGLAAGTYRLGALDAGRPLPPSGKPLEVTVAANEHKTGIIVAADRANGVIEGVVTSADGRPLADAWVSVHQELDDMIAGLLGEQGEGEGDHESRSITVNNSDGGGGLGDVAPVLTDATGHFKLVGLPRVPWTVTAEAQAGGLRGRQLEVTPDAQVTIHVLGVTELRGIAHGASGPATLCTVTLTGPTHAQQSFANPDGSFSFPRVDPGAYTVHVESDLGNGDATAQVVAGQTASVDITLAANAIVIGTVVDSSGQLVAGVPIAIVPASPDGRISVSLSGPPPTTGPDGRFRVETKAGPSALVAMVRPKPVVKNNLPLQAGQTYDVGNVVVDAPTAQGSGQPPPRPPGS